MGAYFLKKQARSPILEGFGRNIYALLSFSGQQYSQMELPVTERLTMLQNSLSFSKQVMQAYL